MGWVLRWFGGWAAAWIVAQYASHAVGMSWHLLAGDFDHTPEWLSAVIWFGVPVVLGARCGWRTRAGGWLVLTVVLSTLGFVLPGVLNYVTGHPGVGEGERSLVHEAAFWLSPLFLGWIPFSMLAAGSAELVRRGLRTYRERVRWAGAR